MSRILLAAVFFMVGAFPVTAQTGTIAATVRMSGAPVANARAILDTTHEVRTDSTGRFQFRDIAPGRHSLAVLAIGATPYSVNLIVAANDTLDFEVVLVRTVTLDSVLVEGSTVRQGFVRAFEDRKRVGLGKYMDSSEVKRFPGVPQALKFIPGVKARAGDTVYLSDSMGQLCLPHIWIDMQNWGRDQGVIRTMRPDDVMAIEVYSRSVMVPDEFRPRGLDRGCGALVIWTRRFWPEGKKKP